ncbi:serine hydrolase domain-containing protein [Kribbella shirazensis]|uniref:D-alanyl-D-alanine carboxypeptidase n=1 Tax=Kribbella shirazensis TaxID=1105143 RepID=A0A7X6A5J8_9ACTN|nr:serine hydrolase domain-containing protein [Kribbella shirazensis]NIK61339.1 D-alanyl-D-alanine carboxypeptidase [Kribbella shirazensis]
MPDADSQHNPAMHRTSLSYRRRTAGFVLAGALAFGAVAVPTASAGDTRALDRPATASADHPATLQSDLRRHVESYLKQHGVEEYASAVGLSLSLPGHRSTVDVTAGTMSFETHRPVPADAVWQIGSNTKAFTAVLLLQLEAEHRLSMEDKLGKWLPQYPQWRDVTIRSLLNMTSRIRTYDDPATQMLGDFASDPNRYLSKVDLVSYVADLPPADAKWHYSNTGYVLSEMIIEKVTGTSYSRQLYSRIINPLQLKNTFYRAHLYPRQVTAREPAGYFAVRGSGPMDRLYGQDMSTSTMSWARAAGGILSTLHDLTVWTRALYSGQLLPPKQQAALTSLVSVRTGEPIDGTSAAEPAGFGLGVQQSTIGPLGTFWSYQGGTLGTRVLHVYLPESGVIMAMGVNSFSEPNSIGKLAMAVHATLKAHNLIK